MSSFSGLAFLGAIAIFIYGIRLSRAGVQLLSGDRLGNLIKSLTNNRLKALLTGMGLTLILQSSTATTIMLVGFAKAGLMTLPQAMGVILGADIGSTLVVLLFSIRHISEYALLLLVVGVLLEIFGKRKKTNYISMLILGFGFVFFGMKLMIQVTSPLKESPLLTEILSLLSMHPIYSFLISIAFTAFVQNSATTLGVTIALAFSGILNIQQAIPLMLGANVGTCAGSVISSLGNGPMGRRVAFSHLFFKLAGASIVLAFIAPFVLAIEAISAYLSPAGTTASQVALSHVVFNLSLALLFLPFISQGAWLMKKIIPESMDASEKPFGAKYLDEKALETPPLAFANVKREILHMAEISSEMFERTIMVFKKNDTDLMSFLEEQDNQVDILDKSIKMYLAKISQESLTPEQAKMELNLVGITSDLEEICDVITRNILEQAAKKIQRGCRFSDQGWQQIRDFHNKVVENFQLTTALLTKEDQSILHKMIRHEKHLELIEEKYRESHLHRLHKGLKEAIDTSSIHIDLLSNFRRVNSKLMAIVKAALPKTEMAT